jgi:hypothetical protein
MSAQWINWLLLDTKSARLTNEVGVRLESLFVEYVLLPANHKYAFAVTFLSAISRLFPDYGIEGGFYAQFSIKLGYGDQEKRDALSKLVDIHKFLEAEVFVVSQEPEAVRAREMAIKAIKEFIIILDVLAKTRSAWVKRRALPIYMNNSRSADGVIMYWLVKNLKDGASLF